MKRILYTFFFFCLAVVAQAQKLKEEPVPKWAAKVQKSIVSVLTYNQKNELLHRGVGVYVGRDGQVIASYALFCDAYSAQIVDFEGRKYPIERVLGASDVYGMAKVKATIQKNPYLPLTSLSDVQKNEKVYILGYSKNKYVSCPSTVVAKTDTVENQFAYYTLGNAFDSIYDGDILFDAKGQLLGLMLPSIGGQGYAIDACLSSKLKINAIHSKLTGIALQKIHIPKAIPDTPEEALVYLYFQSKTASNDDYLDMVNLFVHTYPENAEGYYRRATPLLDLHRFDEAASDLDTYLKLAGNKMVAHSNVAQTITSKLLYQPNPVYEKWTYDLALSHVNQALEMAEKQLSQATTDSLRDVSKATIVEYKLQKAQVMMGKKDYHGAISVYDEINAGPYRSASTFLASSLAHEAAHDSIGVQIAMMDSALSCFYNPLPRDAANYVMRRAKLFSAAKLYKKSVLDYNTYAMLMGDQLNDAFYYDRAMVELEGRMYQLALNDLDKAIELMPREPLYHVEKSALYLRVGEIDKCIDAARESISLDGANSDAYRILGYALLQKGDKINARKNLEKAKSLGDESSEELIEKYFPHTPQSK